MIYIDCIVQHQTILLPVQMKRADDFVSRSKRTEEKEKHNVKKEEKEEEKKASEKVKNKMGIQRKTLYPFGQNSLSKKSFHPSDWIAFQNPGQQTAVYVRT